MELVNAVFVTGNGSDANSENGANFGYVCIVSKRGRKMKKFEVNRLYEMAIKKWGADSQIAKAVEECAELIVTLAKNNSIDDILEEMADVEIMLEQLKLIFNYDFQLNFPYISKFHAFKNQKLKRLKERLEE